MDDNAAPKNFYIVDGFNILFRAFYAVPSLTRSDQMPVGALYGFLSSMTKIVELETPPHLLVALDSPGGGVRHAAYPEYKQNRGAAPEDLLAQISHLPGLLDALGVPYALEEQYEADDVIAAYTKLALSQGLHVVIVSSDKDLTQLVDARVSLLNPGTFARMDVAGVYDKFGVQPHMMQEYLMLVGDTSDNVPGARGVGAKTAAKLLTQYGDIATIYDHVDELKPAMQKSFAQFKDFHDVSRNLIRLYDDIPCHKSVDDCRWAGCPQSAIDTVVKTYEFFSLKNRLVFLKSHEEPAPVCQVVPLDDKALRVLSEAVRLYGYLNILKTEEGTLCSSGDNIVYAMPSVSPELQRVIDDQVIRCVAWDVSDIFDHVCVGQYDDVHILTFLAYGVTSRSMVWSCAEILDIIGPCEAQDSAALCLALHKIMEQCLVVLSQRGMLTWYVNVELPMLNVLRHMERRGMRVCLKTLQSAATSLEDQMATLSEKILSEAGRSFNIASSQQLATVLYDDLQIIPKNRQRSTDATVLESFRDHAIVNDVLQWRQMHKLLTTYAVPLQEKAVDGIVHTNFLSVHTLSGRLSSSNPNLQNIPIRSDMGKNIRQAFIAREGMVLLICDYSQIELRLLAHYAGEGMLRQAFRAAKDIHCATAALIYDVPEDAVTSAQRSAAKTINFGLVYGMGVTALAQRLSIEKGEARVLLDACLGRYPEIAEYAMHMQQQAEQFGYVETIYGRRCYLPLISSINMAEKNHALRQAINVPLQASNADIMKRVMVQLPRINKEFSAHLLLQVHDELVLEVPKEAAKALCAKVRNCMEQAAQIDVDLVVDTHISAMWSK